MNAILGKDVMIGYVRGKKTGLVIIDYDEKKVIECPIGDNNDYGGEVCQIMATPDSEFIIVGVPETNSFCVLTFDKLTLTMKLQKRIHVDGFRYFEMDKYAT